MESYTGSCEGKYLQKGAAAIVAVVAMLFIYYVYTFMKDANLLRESMCGGGDQRCPCSGNETMVGSRAQLSVTDNELTRASTGY